MAYSKQPNVIIIQNFDPGVFFEENDMRKVDREFTFYYLFCMGLRQVKIVAEDGKLFFYFVRAEVEPLFSILLSGKPVPIPDFHELTKGIETWRNALVTLKTLRQEQREA